MRQRANESPPSVLTPFVRVFVLLCVCEKEKERVKIVVPQK